MLESSLPLKTEPNLTSNKAVLVHLICFYINLFLATSAILNEVLTNRIYFRMRINPEISMPSLTKPLYI